MSFGLGSHERDVEDAVKEAYSKNIIMFAAASNNGGNSGVTYPARYDEVICIFSTDGWGNGSFCNPTPTKNSSQFATLGEAVKSAWPIHLAESYALEQRVTRTSLATPEPGQTPLAESPVTERRMTGTSFATPIAAGVAACVLEFSLMNGMDDDLYQVLRSRKGMKALFFEWLGEERDGLHYIHPWKLFSKSRTEDVILTLIKVVLQCLNSSN
jgi:subtilisin family serine protease